MNQASHNFKKIIDFDLFNSKQFFATITRLVLVEFTHSDAWLT